MHHWGAWTHKNICRFTFNTAFIPFGGVLVLAKEQIDPDKFKKSKIVSEKFAVNLIFQPLCQCVPEMELDERCRMCRSSLRQSELNKWQSIKNSLENMFPVDPVV